MTTYAKRERIRCSTGTSNCDSITSFNNDKCQNDFMKTKIIKRRYNECWNKRTRCTSTNLDKYSFVSVLFISQLILILSITIIISSWATVLALSYSPDKSIISTSIRQHNKHFHHKHYSNTKEQTLQPKSVLDWYDNAGKLSLQQRVKGFRLNDSRWGIQKLVQNVRQQRPYGMENDSLPTEQRPKMQEIVSAIRGGASSPIQLPTESSTSKGKSMKKKKVESSKKKNVSKKNSKKATEKKTVTNKKIKKDDLESVTDVKNDVTAIENVTVNDSTDTDIESTQIGKERTVANTKKTRKIVTTNTVKSSADRSEKVGSKTKKNKNKMSPKLPKKKKPNVEKDVNDDSSSASTETTNDDSIARSEIIHALQEKDAAEVLGDAIRSRVDQLRGAASASIISNSNSNNHPSIQSVGWAMGASDYTTRNTVYQEMIYNTNETIDNGDLAAAAASIDSGGVSALPSSVIAHYFLKSHGGAHAIQCLCSLLSVVAGFFSLIMIQVQPVQQVQQQMDSTKQIQIILQRRCLTFAMIKHVTGLLSACLSAAQAIPKVGFRQSRLWIKNIVHDPVSQYVFYSACVLVWLPQKQQQQSMLLPINTLSDTTATTTVPPVTLSRMQQRLLSVLQVPQWQSLPLINFCFIGPVLIREVISTIFVLSDVLILWSTAANSGDERASLLVRTILISSRNIVNAVMCILVTPTVWKSSTASQRQEILAKITSKVSLLMEVIVGIIMFIDCIWNCIAILFSGTAGQNNSSGGSSVFRLMKRIICTQLYLHFLWVRKSKVRQLHLDIRGGASQVPFHIFDLLLNPMKRMGIVDETLLSNKKVNNNNNLQKKVSLSTSSTVTSKQDDSSVPVTDSNTVSTLTWLDYIRIALGVAEES